MAIWAINIFYTYFFIHREGDSSNFLVDGRVGHAAIAFSLIRQGSISKPEKILTLVHHILKVSNFDLANFWLNSGPSWLQRWLPAQVTGSVA